MNGCLDVLKTLQETSILLKEEYSNFFAANNLDCVHGPGCSSKKRKVDVTAKYLGPGRTEVFQNFSDYQSSVSIDKTAGLLFNFCDCTYRTPFLSILRKLVEIVYVVFQIHLMAAVFP